MQVATITAAAKYGNRYYQTSRRAGGYYYYRSKKKFGKRNMDLLNELGSQKLSNSNLLQVVGAGTDDGFGVRKASRASCGSFNRPSMTSSDQVIK